MLCVDRPEDGAPHPPGHRADADVCELLHPLSDERGGQSACGPAPVRAEERYADTADPAGGQPANLRREVSALSAHGGGAEAGAELERI